MFLVWFEVGKLELVKRLEGNKLPRPHGIFPESGNIFPKLLRSYSSWEK